MRAEARTPRGNLAGAVAVAISVCVRMAVPISIAFTLFKELWHHMKSDGQRASEHFVCRVLHGAGEVGGDPFADEVIGDGDFQAVLLKFESS